MLVDNALNVKSFFSLRKERSLFQKELINFYLFILLNVIVVYYMPKIVNQIFYLFTLVLFWNSKKNYFWFAFLLFITFQPGGLFQTNELANGKVLGFYNITHGITLHYFDLFVPIAFLKALKRKKKLPFYFNKEFQPLYFLAFLTMLITVAVGIEIKVFISIIRYWLPFSFLYSIPRLLTNKKEFYLLIYLILPTAFFILFAQILLALFDYNIMTFLTGNIEYNNIYKAIMQGDTAKRATNFFDENILLNIIFALTMILTKNKLFSKKYLNLIILVSSFSIIISATRQWIAMLIFGVFYFLFFIIKKKMNFLIKGFFIALLFFGLAMVIPSLNNLVSESLGRFITLDKIAKEGADAEGSANMRFNVRLPYALVKISKSPIIGWGFTDEFIKIPREYQGKQVTSPTGDYHTGNFNIIANVGILGFLFFLVFWIRVIKKFLSQMKIAPPHYKKAINIFLMFYIIFLIVHFISYQFFGLTQTALQNYFMVIYYLFASIIFEESRTYRLQIVQQNKIL